MIKKTFRYFLEYGDSVSEIPHAPKGYEDSTVSYRRDLNYWGVIRSFSFPLKFVLSGGHYLKKLVLSQGVDAIAVLRVDRLVHETLEYETIYRGELDLSQAVVDNTGIEIPLMDGDLQSKIKAYGRTPFEFDLESGGVEVNLYGTDYSDLFNVVAAGNMSWAVAKILGTEATGQSETGAFEVSNQVEEEFVNSLGQRVVDFSTSSNYILTSPGGTTVNIKGTLVADFKNFGTSIRQTYRVRIYSSQNPNGITVATLASTEDFPGSQEYVGVTFNIDQELTLAPGVKYFLVVQPVLNSNVDVFFRIQEFSLAISKTGTTESTKIKAFKPSDLLAKLVNRIRPSTETRSEVLENSQILITSGDAIRGLPSPVLKTSFDDFYKAMDSVLCIGMSTHDNVAIIEEREYFFRNTNRIVDLPDIKDLQIVPFDEVMYSNIKVGYPDETYEDPRGREEFNQLQNWKTPSYRVQKELDLVSPYRADQFGIEQLLKKNFDPSANNRGEDAQGDNSVFLLWVKKNTVMGVYQLKTGQDFDSLSGVTDRTYTYNIDLSPKRNLLRHMPFIKSTLWGVNENGYIQLTSASKNSNLEASEGHNIIIENEPIYAKDFNDRVFIPFVVRFKTDYPIDVKKLIDTSPEGFIRFKWGNYYFSSYIYEVQVDLAKNSEQEWKVILSKDNNILNLL